jgi:mRNA-degrading endonuclease HigB of HigAB toxin-antitoxin module
MIPYWEHYCMRLIGREKLHRRLRHMEAGAAKWVRSWVAEIIDAHWRKPSDVTTQFPNARHQGGDSFLFPVERSDLAIRLQIAFPQGIAFISDLNSNDETYGN